MRCRPPDCLLFGCLSARMVQQANDTGRSEAAPWQWHIMKRLCLGAYGASEFTPKCTRWHNRPRFQCLCSRAEQIIGSRARALWRARGERRLSRGFCFRASVQLPWRYKLCDSLAQSLPCRCPGLGAQNEPICKFFSNHVIAAARQYWFCRLLH